MITFKINTRYPLKDTSQYGARYRYALTQSEGIPKQCWIVDCWIVDQHGHRHPGIDAVPIPVQHQDVYISKGVPCEVEYEPQAWCGWQ